VTSRSPSSRPAARTGDAVAIASYLGTSNAFDRAIAMFAEAYAAQNQVDYDAFVAAGAARCVRRGAVTTR
jgi:uncharacterized protein DUF2252